ncbi:MAG: ABC transporter ATP-binding protein, partial [Chitinophagaceae bacterium]
MSTIIEIQGLGKKYKLASSQRYLALRDMISNAGRQIFRKKNTDKEFWALQNIDLDIKAGERVGIVGKNGAGKSTLLKILSKITPPTSGQINMHGRVASLLEVGTGFHPELSGRENIFLNGAILGLSKKEIKKKLDEIIDFSGVGNFIEMPLKHYSSGMQLRLAFSVAAHLDPEILLIDEVLAVGDMEFQKKCLGKMEEISQTGNRTILFVSHNLTHLKQICQSGVLLQEGKLIGRGPIQHLSDQYVSLVHQYKSIYAGDKDENTPYIKEAVLMSGEKTVTGLVNAVSGLCIHLTISSSQKISNSLIAIRITNQENIP